MCKDDYDCEDYITCPNCGQEYWYSLVAGENILNCWGNEGGCKQDFCVKMNLEIKVQTEVTKIQISKE